ncbi:MAG TPA: ArsI/CadI family heavy metal resistance metalloenzyme [Pseudomonadota bacterium]|nr:ArsI/CadI family heavy metal resistance metalloenzyme [Pseudomonadota bacterium]HRA36764.1 ArsI/CadI family heavy metal resistance metalloenzyme [Pseudomonadota bacterium]
MKRFHVHLNVAELEPSIRFYSQLFGSAPAVHQPDYAKWMLDDPRLNFAISAMGRPAGVDHLGLQVETGEELAALGRNLDAAGGEVLTEDGTTCCYARSDKAWTVDPQGTRWETFHTFGSATTYYAGGGGCGDDKACAPQASARAAEAAKTGGACCGPDATKAACTVAAPIVAVAGASAAAAAHGCC